MHSNINEFSKFFEFSAVQHKIKLAIVSKKKHSAENLKKHRELMASKISNALSQTTAE